MDENELLADRTHAAVKLAPKSCATRARAALRIEHALEAASSITHSAHDALGNGSFTTAARSRTRPRSSESVTRLRNETRPVQVLQGDEATKGTVRTEPPSGTMSVLEQVLRSVDSLRAEIVEVRSEQREMYEHFRCAHVRPSEPIPPAPVREGSTQGQPPVGQLMCAVCSLSHPNRRLRPRTGQRSGTAARADPVRRQLRTAPAAAGPPTATNAFGTNAMADRDSHVSRAADGGGTAVAKPNNRLDA
jgi:hypothetical protein